MRTMPIQRPISVWFGGGVTDRMLGRMAMLGDGWIEP
jgi:alkanesulfonate monooxygenase SsuD/methylene tetrahydromethanopterin reductase-like flavin-dependent oxidoreductase (luciferase family)